MQPHDTVNISQAKPVLSAAYLGNHLFLYTLSSVNAFSIMHNHLHPRYNLPLFHSKKANE